MCTVHMRGGTKTSIDKYLEVCNKSGEGFHSPYSSCSTPCGYIIPSESLANENLTKQSVITMSDPSHLGIYKNMLTTRNVYINFGLP